MNSSTVSRIPERGFSIVIINPPLSRHYKARQLAASLCQCISWRCCLWYHLRIHFDTGEHHARSHVQGQPGGGDTGVPRPPRRAGRGGAADSRLRPVRHRPAPLPGCRADGDDYRPRTLRRHRGTGAGRASGPQAGRPGDVPPLRGLRRLRNLLHGLRAAYAPTATSPSEAARATGPTPTT